MNPDLDIGVLEISLDTLQGCTWILVLCELDSKLLASP